MVKTPPRHEVPPGQSASVVHDLPLLAPPKQMSVLKAPRWLTVWPGQKSPPAFDSDAEPVVSGLEWSAMSPMFVAHRPLGQSLVVAQAAPLFDPR